ncbi:MAG TPA: prepilin-type N-terminal cleavage/methylation domain-containing protein [Hymenobacter sp.]|jgi:type IV pilus assembly protein PilE
MFKILNSLLKKPRLRLDAFTLTELLIVLVIIGILVLLALPSLMPLISRTRSVEAKEMLTHLQALEKTYFYEHSRYSNNLDEIGFEQEKLATEQGKANYRIAITSAGPTEFSANATAVVDFDGDGTYNIWVIDQDKNLVETTKD